MNRYQVPERIIRDLREPDCIQKDRQYICAKWNNIDLWQFIGAPSNGTLAVRVFRDGNVEVSCVRPPMNTYSALAAIDELVAKSLYSLTDHVALFKCALVEYNRVVCKNK